MENPTGASSERDIINNTENSAWNLPKNWRLQPGLRRIPQFEEQHVDHSTSPACALNWSLGGWDPTSWTSSLH